MSVEEEVSSKFGSSANKPDLIDKFQQLSKIFAISIEDLYINWESFIITKHDGKELELNVENLTRLQAFIQEKLEKKLSHANSTIKATKRVINNSSASSPFNMIPSTPSLLRKKQQKTSSSDTPSRKLVSPETPLKTPTPLKNNESGKVIESLNNQIPIAKGLNDEDIDDANPVKLVANFDAKKYQFRTMRTKLLEAADVLDDQIDYFIQLIKAHHKLPDTAFQNPSIISQSEIITVGRIVPDNAQTSTDVQLNSASLALETSRILGIGRRINLDLSNLSNYSLFPGQIVALKGKNASGEVFKVDEILEVPLLGSPISNEDELFRFHQDLKIMVVSGPYTTNNDLNFSALKELVEKINYEIKPHVVIFFGPFIDITHPLISSGNLDLEFDSNEPQQKPKNLDEVFKLIISPVLKKINTLTKCILIPSLKDSIVKHASYPQDSIEKKKLALAKNFIAFPNPSIFQVNETLIGVSNNDIFKDLKDVIKGDELNVNRFDRISDHILTQRRFYPLFPSVSKYRKTNDGNVEVLPSSNLEVPYLGLTEFSEVIPDVLIIPSELRYFARVVKNTLIINPGNFMKPNSKGTFAVISVKKPSLEDLTKVETSTGDNQTHYLHNIWKRARVDIIKS